MGQTANKPRRQEGEAICRVRNLRISPQKLNLVAASIRGKSAQKAVLDLEFSKKRIAQDVLKGLQSAIANAENNHGLDIDRLFVKEAYVGKALVMKRFRARARGRAFRILKPFSHLTLVVAEQTAEAPKTEKKAAPKKETAAKKTEAKKAPAKKAPAKKQDAKKETK